MSLNDGLDRRILLTVLFTVFLGAIGFGVLIPVTPQLFTAPGSAQYLLPSSWTVQQGYVLLGWLIATYSIAQFFATPILGEISDRYGRRKILAISLAGSAAGYVIFALGIVTRNIPLLFLGRAIDGITGSNISVAQTVIADISTSKNRTRNFGLIGAIFGSGLVFGPYIGGLLSSPSSNILFALRTPQWFGPSTPFWFISGLSLINVLLVLARLPETLARPSKNLDLHLGKSLQNIRLAASTPKLKVVLLSVFLYWGGFTFFTTFFQVYLASKLHFTPRNIGAYFAFLGIVIIVTQGVLTRRIAKRYRHYQVIRLSMLMTGLSLVLLLFAKNTSQLLSYSIFFAMFNGLTSANTTSLISASASRKVQGQVLGLSTSVRALAQAIPAIMAGYIATIHVDLPILVGGGFMVGAGLIANFIYSPDKILSKEELGT